MAFPVLLPVLTQSQSVNAIAEAEAGIAQCLADLLCNTLFPNIDLLEDVEEQVELTKIVLCAASKKEAAMAAVIDALANKICADKGMCNRNNGNNDKDCC